MVGLYHRADGAITVSVRGDSLEHRMHRSVGDHPDAAGIVGAGQIALPTEESIAAGRIDRQPHGLPIAIQSGVSIPGVEPDLPCSCGCHFGEKRPANYIVPSNHQSELLDYQPAGVADVYGIPADGQLAGDLHRLNAWRASTVNLPPDALRTK